MKNHPPLPTRSSGVSRRSVGIEQHDERGFALIPAMMIVSGLAIFTMALMTATLSNNRTLVSQADDYRLTSAVETSAILAVEEVWSNYLTYLDAKSLPQTIENFRTFMNVQGVFDMSDEFDEDDDGIVELIPGPEDGFDLLQTASLPVRKGRTQISDVYIDAMQIVRIDTTTDATQLFLTISASTAKGGNLVNPIRNRAVQQVYTVEPEEFSGFEFALLGNNVNCIFCHTNVDTVEHWFGNGNEHERVRVGALETLMVRKDMDGDTTVFNDGDADSFVAGTIYSRGVATLQDGTPITNWSQLSLSGFEFSENPYGKGIMGENPFPSGNPAHNFDDYVSDFMNPAGDPPDPFENLYLGYELNIEDQVDGPLPSYFPAPIPDDGGRDPATGLPDPSGIANRIIDDAEYAKVANEAKGAITAGVLNVSPPGTTITTPAEYAAAVFTGNATSVQKSVDGNVVLTGTRDNPITIDGTVAIDGDLIIQGWVRGEGSLIVRGNVYIPTDLVYYDGIDSDGKRTFGMNQGSVNALGLTAGGNIIVGDYQRPATQLPDGSLMTPGTHEIISGNPDTGVLMDDKWNFALTEMAIFNRAEWAKTQPLLPAKGDPVGGPWTAVNPNYDPNYTPRYYGYGDDTIIPIQNKSRDTKPDPLDPTAPFLYFDPALNTWIGDTGSYGWDTERLTYVDPTNPNDPYLFDGSGNPIAVTNNLSPQNDWIAPDVYQMAAEWFHDNRGPILEWQPLQIDGLLYTNNAIFSIVHQSTNMRGRMVLNGSIVAADLGMLVPGHHSFKPPNANESPLSGYQIGLQLNYDKRVKGLLNVTNPLRVQLKRTLWNPTANIL